MNDTKEQSHLSKFIELVNDQFAYGGKKYGLNSTRESTDVLFEKHGHGWLFGTMDKYTFRYRNLQRERDILKIATYCFITWLKRGFWIKNTGLSEVIDTNIQVKSEQFPNFITKVTEYIDFLEDKHAEKNDSDYLNMISNILFDASNQQFSECKETDLFAIFRYCYHIWRRNYAETETHDTDTYNESQPK